MTGAVRVGTDIVCVAAVERRLSAGGDFRQTFLSERELAIPGAEGWSAERIAGRLAAKEAAVKALGTGLRTDLRQVEVHSDGSGRPRLALLGEAGLLAERLGVMDVDVSISHTGGLAVAVTVFAMAQPTQPIS